MKSLFKVVPTIFQTIGVVSTIGIVILYIAVVKYDYTTTMTKSRKE